MRGRALAAMVMVLASNVAMAGNAHRWKPYANVRFGTHIEYPADIFTHAQFPDNNDGVILTAADGAELRVFGSYALDDLGTTPRSYSRFINQSEKGRVVTYRAISKSILVESGTQSGLLFYERYDFRRGDVIDAMQLTYRPSVRSEIEPLIGRIGRSLGGNGGVH